MKPIKFDYEGAVKAGYSDEDIAIFLGEKAGYDSSSALEAGLPSSEIINFIRRGGAPPDTSHTYMELLRGPARGLVGLPGQIASFGEALVRDINAPDEQRVTPKEQELANIYLNQIKFNHLPKSKPVKVGDSKGDYIASDMPWVREYVTDKPVNFNIPPDPSTDISKTTGSSGMFRKVVSALGIDKNQPEKEDVINLYQYIRNQAYGVPDPETAKAEYQAILTSQGEEAAAAYQHDLAQKMAKAIPMPKMNKYFSNDSWIIKFPTALAEGLTTWGKEFLYEHPELDMARDIAGAKGVSDAWKKGILGRYAVAHAAESIPQIALNIGINAAADIAGVPQVGLAISASLMGAMEGGSSYQDLIRSGVSKNDAADVSTVVAVINGLLEQVPMEGLINGGGGRVFRKLLGKKVLKALADRPEFSRRVLNGLIGGAGQMMEEGVTEGLQEVVSNAATAVVQENASLMQNVPTSMLVGALMGVFTGSVSGVWKNPSATKINKSFEGAGKDDPSLLPVGSPDREDQSFIGDINAVGNEVPQTDWEEELRKAREADNVDSTVDDGSTAKGKDGNNVTSEQDKGVSKNVEAEENKPETRQKEETRAEGEEVPADGVSQHTEYTDEIVAPPGEVSGEVLPKEGERKVDESAAKKQEAEQEKSNNGISEELSKSENKPTSEPEATDDALIPEPKTYDELAKIPENTVYKRGDKFLVRGENPRGGGDTIHPTVEDAQKEVELNKKREAQRLAAMAKIDKEVEQEADAAKADEDIDGFADDITGIQKSRILSTLNKVVRINGVDGKRKERLTQLVNDGYNVVNETKKKANEDEAGNITTTTVGTGNRILQNSEGAFFTEEDITKTGMDYAEHLQSKLMSQGKPDGETIAPVEQNIEGENGKSQLSTADVPLSEPGEIPQTQGGTELDRTTEKQKGVSGQEEEVAAREPALTISELSEKSIIIKGETKTHKDAIKALGGGLWNRKHQGWIFSKKHREKVQSLVDKINGNQGETTDKSPATLKTPFQEGMTPYEKFKHDLENKGAARTPSGKDYKIINTDNGFAYTETENGARVTKGGVAQNKWSIQTARDKIIEAVKHEFERLETDKGNLTVEAGNKGVQPNGQTIDDEINNIRIDDLGAMFDEAGNKDVEHGDTPTPTNKKNKAAVEPLTDKNIKIGDYVVAVKSTDVFGTKPLKVHLVMSNGVKLEGKGNLTFNFDNFKKSRKPRAPKADVIDGGKSPQTAADIIAAATKAGIQGLEESVKGLHALFGGSDSTLMSFPAGFNQDTYAQARPHFAAALDKFRQAGQGLREFVAFVRDKFGASAKMYLIQFVQDLKDGKLDKDGNLVTIKGKGGQLNEEGTDGNRRDGTGHNQMVQPEVPGDEGGRRSDAQHGVSQGNNGTLEVEQPADVGGAGQGEDAGQGGIRATGTNVEGERGESAVGDALHQRPRTGGQRLADAGTGGTTGGRVGSGVSSDGGAGLTDFHVDDPLKISGGGQVARFNKNKAAIELFNSLIDEGRTPSHEEQAILAGYTGWGSFGQELFKGTWSRPEPKEGWEARDRWLRDNLTKEEWESAQKSILNSHYTDPPTVMAMWSMIEKMGFSGGRVLEPAMGIGNFFGLMPEHLKSRSKLAGIELDEVTGQIAKFLYPNANIHIKAYQDSKTPDNFYDLVIGNWPFDSSRPVDRKYMKLKPVLHDYFFLKALDQVRPGGLVVGITSNGTMDKVDKSARRAMARKGELIAAFRLPSGAFKEYAGTSVVTDILIFRKRETPVGIVSDSWVETDAYETQSGMPVRLNKYYIENPQNVIGEIDYGHGTTTGRPGLIVNRPHNMMQRLNSLSDKLSEGVYSDDPNIKQISYITNHTDDRQGSLIETENGLFIVQGEHLAPANDVNKIEIKDKKKTAERKSQLSHLITLRKDYAKLIDAERNGGDHQAAREVLNKNYKAFVDKYGIINESYGLKYLEKIKDPFFPSMSALEKNIGTKETPDFVPAQILTESTMRIDTANMENLVPSMALIAARNKSINPRLSDIAALSNKSEGEVKKELIESGAIYELPNGDIAPADIYLSGNVREKLEQAQAALDSGNKAMENNVRALMTVIPKDVPYHQIDAQLGASWVPTTDYAEYVAHMLNLSNTDDIDVTFTAGKWMVRFPKPFNLRTEARTGYGMDDRRVPFSRLVNAAFSNQTINVKGRDEDDNVVVDQDATAEASEKVAMIRESFQSWIWQDSLRRGRLVKHYNNIRNAYASPQFDGSFLTFPGMALSLGEGPFDLRKHQANAILRGLVTKKSLNAHEVGTGKAQPLDAKILTPSGWALMGEMRPGMEVIGADGLPTTVEAVFPQGEKEIFDVIFSDGSKTQCCEEHLWITHTFEERSFACRVPSGKDWNCAKPKARSLKEIRETLIGRNGTKNHKIPMMSAAKMNSRELLIPPYTMGCLLGDGGFTSKSITFSTADIEVLDDILLEVPTVVANHRGHYDFALVATDHRNFKHPIREGLRKYSLLGLKGCEKFVPDDYLLSSIEDRVSLLQGLMDTDGTVDRRGYNCSFSSTSEQLANDVVTLCQSLGGTGKISSRQTYCNGKAGLPSYTVTVSLPPQFCPFKLKRKAEVYKPKTKYLPSRFIVEVVAAGRKQAQCIRVSNKDHLYVTDDYILTHNTFTIAGIAVESRRYGIAKKPLILAHNANSATVAAEVNEMYPAAKVLYIDNLSPKNIDTRLRQIANDDWDAIVLPHSLINRLALTEETLMAMAQEELDQLENEARLAAEDDDVAFTDDMLDDPDELKKLRSPTAKDLVRARNRILESIARQAAESAREGAIPFEELGIDMILVDEVHEFKKPPISTRMRIKGLNVGTSNKSIALRFLTKYIRANNSGGNVHLFTGTPITNTLTEIYHMMRYIMEEEMSEQGIDFWDGWFGSFASEVQDVELSAAGEYESIIRLAAFINLPELRKMIGQYMDVVFSDDMEEMKPRTTESGKTLTDPTLTEEERDFLENGRTEGAKGRPYKKIIVDNVDMSPEQLAAFRQIQTYANQWRDMNALERKKAMQSGAPQSPIIYEGLAAKAGFDVRLLDGERLFGQEGNTNDQDTSKASRAVTNLMDIYRGDKRATQVVFSEIGLGKKVSRTRQESDGSRTKYSVNVFSTISDIVERLVAEGVPREEIAVVTGNTSKKKRKEIADAMNEGTIRIVFGNRKTLGTGVNMQKNLRAMHHLDAPWMPGELEQSNGRGWRQGNQWNTVLEIRYITDRLDGRRWQVLAVKDKFIKAFLKSDDSIRTLEGDAASDLDSSILDTFSQAAGDPRILLLAKARKKVEALIRKQSLHDFAMVDAADQKETLFEQRSSTIEYLDKLKGRETTAADRMVAAAKNKKRSKPETPKGLPSPLATNNDAAARIADAVIKGKGPAQAINDELFASIQKNKGMIATAKRAMAANKGDKFSATIGDRTVSTRKKFNTLLENHLARAVADMKEHEIGVVFGFPLYARKQLVGGYSISLRVNDTRVPVNAPSIGSVESALRKLQKNATMFEKRLDEIYRSLDRLDEVLNTPFAYDDELKAKIKLVQDIEKDMDENPVPPPAWLRNGAPVESDVYWNEQKYEVTGHRWTQDGWYVLVQDQDDSQRYMIPYAEVKDSQGYEIYEKKEFEPPEIIGSINKGEEQQQSKDDNVAFFSSKEKKQRPWYYSALSRGAEKVNAKSMQSHSWINAIKKAGTGIKQEEIEWTGLADWLAAKKGKVPKDEVIDFLKKGGVQIEEVQRKAIDTKELSDLYFQRGLLRHAGESSASLDEKIKLLEDKLKNTKYSEYTIPNGTNYREVLLILPGKNFKSKHWDERGVIAHLRLTDREVNGEKVLFIEEVQSDWSLGGRKQGFTPDVVVEYWKTKDAEGNVSNFTQYSTKEEAERNKPAGGSVFKLGEKTIESFMPPAPFVMDSSWQNLALKRVMRMAAEEGYSRVAWITGEQTANRYSLDKKIDAIYAFKQKNGGYFINAIDKRGDNHIGKVIPNDEIETYLGKEIAGKILSGENIDKDYESPPGEQHLSRQTFTGDDLKVESRWTRELYDNTIPRWMKKFGKKYGVIPEAVDPGTGAKQLSLPVTDKMRSDIMGGLPLFSIHKSGINNKGGVKHDPPMATDNTSRLQAQIEEYTGKTFAKDSYQEVKVSDEYADVAKKLEKVFNKTIVFFKQTNPDALDFNGVVFKKDTKTIFINVDGDYHVQTILGHEVTHKMKNEAPDIYRDFLRAALSEMYTDEFAIQHLKMAEARSNMGKETPTKQETYDEMLGDFMGDNFADEKFWNKIAARMPKTFGKLARFINKYLNKIKSRMKLMGMGSSSYFRDVEKVQDAAAKALSDYMAAKNERLKTAGKDAFSAVSTDREYFDAVDRGDMEAAQEMVDEAAKKAGYDVVDYANTEMAHPSDLSAYHLLNISKGAKETYNSAPVADRKKLASLLRDFRKGKYIGPPVLVIGDQAITGTHRLTAARIADKEVPIYRIDDPELAAEIDDVEHYEDIGDILANYGYDNAAAIFDEQVESMFGRSIPNEYPVGKRYYSSTKEGAKGIKSLDPITYDDNGDIIPPSKRFNPEKNDIRFSRRKAETTETDNEQGEKTNAIVDTVTGGADTARDIEEDRLFTMKIFEYRDLAQQKANNIASKMEQSIQRLAGSTKKWKGPLAYNDLKDSKKARQLSAAMMIYRDLKRDPSAAQRFRDWSKEQLASFPLGKVATRKLQEKIDILDLATNLSAQQKDFVDGAIDTEFKAVGKRAQAAGLIKTLLDNYVRRLWTLPDKGKFTGLANGYGFKVWTTASKQRTLNTILDGWIAGYELKVEGIHNSYDQIAREIADIEANLAFIISGKKTKDLNGKSLFTTSNIDGYEELKAPGFGVWVASGKVTGGPITTAEDGDITDDSFLLEVNNFGHKVFVAPPDEKDNTTIIYEKRQLKAPKQLASMINKATATESLFDAVPLMNKISKFNQVVKSWILLSSFFHHLAGSRSWIFGTHHGGKINPVSAYKRGLKKIEGMHPIVQLAIKNGLTIGLQQDFDEAYNTDDTVFEQISKRLDIDKSLKVAEWVKQKRYSFTNSLFKHFFAGLKAEAFVVEFTHELNKNKDQDVNRLAEKVATLINADFGGLHLQRMGRNKTLQGFARLLLLAPDWTESNFRTVTGMIPGMNKAISKLMGELPPPPGMDKVYRKFWGRVIFSSVVATLIPQLLINGWTPDDRDNLLDFYREQLSSWDQSRRLRWTAVDITKLYHVLGVDIPDNQRKTFSIVGHFADPLKILDIDRLIKSKGSPIVRIADNLLSGTDWAKRPYTGVSELVRTHKTIKKSRYQKTENVLNRLPSAIIGSAKGALPIQANELISYLMGEQDGWSSLFTSAGAHVSNTYTPDIVGDRYKELRSNVLRVGREAKALRLGGNVPGAKKLIIKEFGSLANFYALKHLYALTRTTLTPLNKRLAALRLGTGIPRKAERIEKVKADIAAKQQRFIDRYQKAQQK